MKYVQRIEDTSLWKDQFEDNVKGKAKTQGAYYVINQTGKGDSVGYIRPVAQDIVMAKARIRKYKKRGKNEKKQTKAKRGSKKVKRLGRKKGKGKQRKSKKILKRKRKTKRK